MGSFRLFFQTFAVMVLVGCGNSDDEAAPADCTKPCNAECAAFDACGFALAPGCSADCAASLRHVGCGALRPADQYTCPELEEQYACSAYCSTFCARVPECGSFDKQRCLEGCTYSPPAICNPASVAARTCDQLKPEARAYDDTGSILADPKSEGGHVSSGDENATYGLCATGTQCELPLGCSPATNTCAACMADDECERGRGQAYICSSGECVAVGCATDDDCLTGVCNTSSHSCIQCRSDGDCESGFVSVLPFCNVTAGTCVECTTDSHCTSEYSPRCNVEENRCVECVSSADCTEPFLPVCGSNNYCSPSP